MSDKGTVKNANFRFEKYLIDRANLDFSGKEVSDKIEYGFVPSGVINYEKHLFELTLNVKVHDRNGAFSIAIRSKATFSFAEEEKDKEELKNYFYINAPAILFPYIRAYISNISALSGLPTIILPTLNMAGLRDELKENTAYIPKAD